MSIAALLLSVTASSPQIARTVNVRTDMPLTDLAVAVEAVLGFSGRSPHLLLISTGGSQEVWENELTGTVADLFGEDWPVAVFLYDPPRNWHVSVELLGYPGVEMPTPQLIEMAGPDVVEGCNGPDEMMWLRDAARDFLAGLDRGPGNQAELNHRFPHLSPNQMLRRLTVADDVVVAERLAERMRSRNETPPSFDDAEGASLPPVLEAEFARLGELFDTRPDLQQILETDPDPAQNPVLLQAVEEFFNGLGPGAGGPHATAPDPGIGEELPELDEKSAEAVTRHVRWLIDFIGEGRSLTQAGYLKPADVAAVSRQIGAETYWHRGAKREADSYPVMILRQAMEYFGLLEVRGSRIVATEVGQSMKEHPLTLARYLATRLPLVYERDETLLMLSMLQEWALGTGSGLDSVWLLPEPQVDNYHFLLAVEALDRTADFDEPTRATEAGRAFIGEIFRAR